MVVRSLTLAVLFAALASHHALAQTTYELAVPATDLRSRAVVSDRELRVIDATGRETVYLRDPRSDSPDGRMAAYRNSAASQIIRWPTSSSGSLEIGTIRGGTIDYRPSQMQIQPRADAANRSLPIDRNLTLRGADSAALPSDRVADGFFAQVWQGLQPQPQMLRLATRDDRGQTWYLGHAGGNRVAMFPNSDLPQTDWYVVPAGNGYVRVQQVVAGDWLALSSSPRRALVMERIAQDAGQLWRVVRTNSAAGDYWLESAVAPGFALSGSAAGIVRLLPMGATVGQGWLPQPLPIAPTFVPLWRSVSHEVRPNAPLPPAQVEMINSHSSSLVILVGDRRQAGVRQLSIDPGAQLTVPLDRDAGATLVETYEIRGPNGVWERRQFITPIPAAQLYDVSVYEEFLQSIAIDRTGTSPNPIEDVNYQPRSIGWFPLPPGEALPERSQLDVYAQAKAANNPGAVRRFDPKSLEKPANAPDPLESILKSVQPPPARQKF